MQESIKNLRNTSVETRLPQTLSLCHTLHFFDILILYSSSSERSSKISESNESFPQTWNICGLHFPRTTRFFFDEMMHLTPLNINNISLTDGCQNYCTTYNETPAGFNEAHLRITELISNLVCEAYIFLLLHQLYQYQTSK